MLCWVGFMALYHSAFPEFFRRYCQKGSEDVEWVRMKAVNWLAWLGAGACLSAYYSSDCFAAESLPVSRSFPDVRTFGLGVTPVALQGLPHGNAGSQSPAWVGLDGKARQKEFLRSFYFPGVTLGANGTTRSLAKAYFNGSGSTQQSIENFLKAAQNEQTPYGFFELAPSISMLRLQFGLFARVEVDGYVWSASGSSTQQNQTLDNGAFGEEFEGGVFGLTSSDTQMQVRAEILRGARLAFSVPYKNTGVHLGVQVRPTWRSEYSGGVSLAEPLATEAAKELKAKFNESHGFPLDFGASIRLPRVRFMPMVGLMIEDVSDTFYKAGKDTHQSLIQKSNFKLGASAWLLRGKSVAVQCTVAGEHLNDSRVSGEDKVGVGCEAHVQGRQEADVIVDAPAVLRLGWNSNGLSYGAHWDSPIALIEVGSGAVQVAGPAGFSQRRDQRYYFKLSIDVSGP